MNELVHSIFVHLLIASVYCGWAGNAIVVKLTLTQGTNLVLFGAWRILFATMIMWVFVLVNVETETRVLLRNAVPDIGWFVLTGLLFCYALFGLLYNLTLVSPERTSVFYPCSIVFTVALSMCFGMEPVSSLRVLAVVITITGVVLMEVDSIYAIQSGCGGSAVLWGTTLEIVRQLANSVHSLTIRVLTNRSHPPNFITAVYFSVALLVGFGVALGRFFYAHERTADIVFNWSTDPWRAMVYCVLVSSCYCYNSLSYGLKYLDPSMVAIYSSLVTIGTMVLGIFTLNEYPTKSELIGGGLCITGMLVAIYSQKLSRSIVDYDSVAVQTRAFLEEGNEKLLTRSIGKSEDE